MFSLAAQVAVLVLVAGQRQRKGRLIISRQGQLSSYTFLSLINLLHSIPPCFYPRVFMPTSEGHMLKMTVLFDMILIRVAVKH